MMEARRSRNQDEAHGAAQTRQTAVSKATSFPTGAPLPR